MLFVAGVDEEMADLMQEVGIRSVSKGYGCGGGIIGILCILFECGEYL